MGLFFIYETRFFCFLFFPPPPLPGLPQFGRCCSLSHPAPCTRTSVWLPSGLSSPGWLAEHLAPPLVLHLYSRFIQSALQLIPLIRPFTLTLLHSNAYRLSRKALTSLSGAIGGWVSFSGTPLHTQGKGRAGSLLTALSLLS